MKLRRDVSETKRGYVRFDDLIEKAIYWSDMHDLVPRKLRQINKTRDTEIIEKVSRHIFEAVVKGWIQRWRMKRLRQPESHRNHQDEFNEFNVLNLLVTKRKMQDANTSREICREILIGSSSDEEKLVSKMILYGLKAGHEVAEIAEEAGIAVGSVGILGLDAETLARVMKLREMAVLVRWVAARDQVQKLLDAEEAPLVRQAAHSLRLKFDTPDDLRDLAEADLQAVLSEAEALREAARNVSSEEEVEEVASREEVSEMVEELERLQYAVVMEENKRQELLQTLKEAQDRLQLLQVENEMIRAMPRRRDSYVSTAPSDSENMSSTEDLTNSPRHGQEEANEAEAEKDNGNSNEVQEEEDEEEGGGNGEEEEDVVSSQPVNPFKEAERKEKPRDLEEAREFSLHALVDAGESKMKALSSESFRKRKKPVWL
eukprot:748016-Hanusia_phi.AAC.2